MASTSAPSGLQTPPPSKRPRPPSPNNVPRKRRGIVPPQTSKRVRSDVYHLKKDEIPEDMAGFKSALETHIRILLGAINNYSVPEAPDAHTINVFEQRFTSAADVDRLLKANNLTFRNVDRLVSQSLKDLRTKCAIDPGSLIAAAITRVDEHFVRVIFAAVHSFGLPAWRPDLIKGTPTSFYNAAHESIAIWTFEQAASTFAYRHLSPNLRYLQDTTMIQRLYRNFIWSYMKGLALKELREAGSVLRGLQENKAYKHRLELTKRRQMYLKDNGWNLRVQLLVGEAECTSDQEANPDAPGFLIMRKRARSKHVTDFMYAIDARRQQAPLFRGQRKNVRREEPRTPHPLGKESRISERLPRVCPLDWFDPEYFNSMDITFRALYVDAPIALPLPEDIDMSLNPDWKVMPETTFMERYGNRVLARYNLPTREEMEMMEAIREDQEVEEELNMEE